MTILIAEIRFVEYTENKNTSITNISNGSYEVVINLADLESSVAVTEIYQQCLTVNHYSIITI